MSFRPILVALVYECVRLESLGEYQVFKIQLQILIPIIEFISAQNLSFSSKLPRFKKKNQFPGKFWLKIKTKK
jgi:hypothetical protein